MALERDLVHGAVQAHGVDRVGVSEQDPGVRRKPAGSLGLPGVRELDAGARESASEPVDDVRRGVISRHG
jgi:hypothetical protein